MKKLFLIFTLLVSFFYIQAQESCISFEVVIDTDKFNVGNTNDTSYNVVVYGELLNTDNVSKMTYTLSDSLTGTVLQSAEYTFSSMQPNVDLLAQGNCARDNKNFSLSLGYFEYATRSKKVKFTLYTYDVQNNLLGSSYCYF